MLGSSEEPGVLNMAADDIFEHIASHPHRDFILRASFVEIYNENIRDLLATRSAAPEYISIRVDPRRGVYCEAEERMVSSYEQINALLREGISKRAVEATAMNEQSSRSHTIFR
jgi:centromeric protein E